METGSKSSSSSHSVPQWLWSILLIVSLSLLMLQWRKWTQDASARWSGFLFPVGGLAYALGNLLDSRQGRVYKTGTIVGTALWVGSLISTLLEL